MKLRIIKKRRDNKIEDRKFSSFAVVINNSGEVLLLERGKNSNYPYSWDFPGGGSLKDEKKDKCAIRELEEETGLKTKKVELLFSKKRNGKNVHYFKCIEFVGDVDIGNVKKEHEDFKWVEPNDLDRLKTVPGVEYAIREAFGTKMII